METLETRARLATLVRRLCAPECAGRAPGSPEGRAARALLCDELREAGVVPLADAGQAGIVGYEQPVPGCNGANLIGAIPGRHQGAAERFVLVGAHYDHLGWLTPGQDAYWGADDNAAAVAITVEVARALARSAGQLGRTVLIALFDGEEPPHFLTRGMGSEHFARHPPAALAGRLDRLDLMVCMDLVGHAMGSERHPREVQQTLMVFGAEKSAGTAALVDGLRVPGVAPKRLGINLIPPLSDYHAFQSRQVPFLFLTAGRWRHYHQITDTPERLDYDKMTATARWLELVLREAADRKTPGRDRFLIYGNDDATTLRTLFETLGLLSPFSPHGRDHLRAMERLRQATARRNLDPAEFDQVRLVLAQLEAQLS